MSQFIRCEAPSSLHPGIEWRITPSPHALVRLWRARRSPFWRTVRPLQCSEPSEPAKSNRSVRLRSLQEVLKVANDSLRLEGNVISANVSSGLNHSDRNCRAISWHLDMVEAPRSGNCFTAVDGFKPKLLCASVITIESQDFPNGSSPRLAFHMDHEVHGLCDLRFSVGKCGLSVAAHHEICKATKGLLGRVRVDCGQRS